jgi:hypothetical protein
VITKLQWSHGRLNSTATLQNRRRTTNIFGFLNFETRTEGNRKQSKIFLVFSSIKPKIGNKANQSKSKLKRQIKRNNGNIFGLSVFWKAEIKMRSKKEKENRTWIYKGPTKYDM